MAEKYQHEMTASNGNKHVVQISDVEVQIKKEKKPERRCTDMEKLLGFFLFVSLGTVVVLAVVYAMREFDKKTVTFCTTVDCVNAASGLTEALDETVDPCDNFYDFACGTWRKKTIIPEDRSSINMFGIVRDDVEVILKYLLEEEPKSNEPDAIRKAKDMYKSCMNEDLIEKLGTGVLTNLMKELGGWPVVGSFHGIEWNPASFNITKLLHGLLKYNNRIFMDLYASTDTKNSSTRILYLDQADFGMPGRSYYMVDRNDTMLKAYEQLAVSIAVGLGANYITAVQDMKKVVDLEIELANITIPNEDRRDSEKLYNLILLSDLPKNFTTAGLPFDWIQYVQGALGSPLVQIDIPLDEPIIVRAPLYFERLFNTLAKYDKRTITNYMVWRIMQNRANNLGQKFKDVIQLYNEVIYGTAAARARWRSCTSYINTNLGLALGRLFVREAFEESAKNDTLEMINNLMASFTEILKDAQWMDEATRQVASEKAKHIQRKIGYQNDIMDDEILDEIYENITIANNTYLENVLSVISIISADGFIFLREPVNKNVWSTAPATVNAYYSSVYNRIMFPAGILQPPFYSKGRPKSMNYGGIGVVIGHEITHGFDDRGRQFDKDGNLVQWWSNDVINRFKAQTQCLVKQYGDFSSPEADGMKLNGVNTLGENIADNGGLKESFRAYRTWVAKNGEEPKLPGVSYNHNQIFFISFAQVWCENTRKEAAINSIYTGVHSPGRFRVIGTLQNSKDFSEAFSCRRGSFMNPDKKCYVW